MARQWERVDEDTAVGPRFGQDPPPSFSAPTLAYTYRQWKRDLRQRQATSSLQKNRQGRWLLRQLKGESRTAAEVVMDDALVQDDGIDLIVEELDRRWEVTQDQDKASKIEKALCETQRDVKMETTFMSHVARRKLNFQQLENALGTSLPAVIKGYATLRDGASPRTSALANRRRKLRHSSDRPRPPRPRASSSRIRHSARDTSFLSVAELSRTASVRGTSRCGVPSLLSTNTTAGRAP